MNNLKQQENEFKFYNQALEKDWDCYNAFMCRSQYYMDEQKIDDALRDFKQAIEINPINSIVQYN
ncbi:unnamed protein product [Paramecium pentaurelia]|uniref:Tetratricopeptide repeat protein n=1 Tax=Paramecium pentaurelia TaxID=43138 RepID=A0A8S1XN05_9CILI|nr:unnamed protein product [Paramecium pentaurelia]